MNREKQTEILLYGWLRPKVKEIYFNSVNPISAPIFKVKGQKRRIPDLIILTNKNKFISIEVKPTSNNNNYINEGQSQLFEDQYINYIEDKIDIFIDDKKIEIDNFVLATDSSIKSSIFSINTKYDLLRDNLEDNDPHKRSCVIKYKTMPRFEYVRTHDLVRNLFKTHKQYIKRNSENIKRDSGIGILIADYESGEPYIYVKNKVNNRWGQHYWKI